MFGKLFYKLDEHFDREITHSVIDLVEEHFSKPHTELTKEEVGEIQKFMEENHWSVLLVGLQNVLNYWEEENDYN